jgi:hypothetical protein
MMDWTPYNGEQYLDFPLVEEWCRKLVEAHPDWFSIEEIGTSRHGRSIFLLAVGDRSGALDERPAFWLDGGTHSAEWTGVMAVLHTLSRWAERLSSGDESMTDQFRRRTAYVVPCISPDGFQALCDGAPFLRSSLRPPLEGTHPIGLRPRDLTGDGAVRWMRWRHPSGPWMRDPESPMWMRHRTLDDDPSEAFFFCSEGSFIHWDGVAWVDAPREFGLDLNRNFPGSWEPFSMFGMDGGDYPLSEPESRAVVDAVSSRPNIAVALTNHTYTGCILTQPYRDPTPITTSDIDLFESLATMAVEGTGYRVIKTHPDFIYDPKQVIVGVWSDTLATTFGIPGYTLELWNPYAFAGVTIEKPAEFFRKPDQKLIKQLIEAFAKDPTMVCDWEEFEHPQLGMVEVGGLNYMRTVRNPPEALLPAEVGRGAVVADRMLASTPELQVRLQLRIEGEIAVIDAVVENFGFLPTAASAHAEKLGIVAPIRLDFSAGEGVQLVDGEPTQTLGQLDGWGSLQVESSRHALYPGLGSRGPRARARWVVSGHGELTVSWTAARAGCGSVSGEV